MSDASSDACDGEWSTCGSENREQGSGSNQGSGGSSDGSRSGKSSETGELTSFSGQTTAEDPTKVETRAIFRLRIIVFGILLIATAAVSIIIYMVTTNAESTEFMAQYEGSAGVVLNSFENMLNEHLGTISTVSVAMTAHSIDQYREWPYITLSFIQQRFAKTNQIAGTLYIGFNPLVRGDQHAEWEQFTNSPKDRRWIVDGLKYQEKVGLNQYDEMTANDPLNENLVGSRNLTYDSDFGLTLPELGPGPYLPVWQTSPVLRQGLVNKNRFRDPVFAKWANLTMRTQSAVMGDMQMAPPGYAANSDRSTQFFATILSMNRDERTKYLGDPFTDMFVPVFDSFDENRKSVAVLRAVFHWGSYFRFILPPTTPDLNLVLYHTCYSPNNEDKYDHTSFTYTMTGNQVEPIGNGDQHDAAFDDMEMVASFEDVDNIGDGTEFGMLFNQDECKYSISVYPTQNYYNEYHTNTPKVVTIVVACIFVFATLIFLLYDRLVEHRQRKVLKKATQSTAIVSSLFPKNVRDRIMQHDGKTNFLTPNHRLKKFLGGEDELGGHHAIADLFPQCTVLFADIVGFTAWSSTRDPGQVFDLLQTIYQVFDYVAKKRRVFKVETIGDCYVAVTGLPEPQPDHAVIMVKFAGECRAKLADVTHSLEVKFGPDTADLGMRFGLHSGQVTAGVLRGDRSRFQLFGDTVNTASRIESTGAYNRIHVTQATAKLLVEANKGRWLEERKDPVEITGKGTLHTFWVNPRSRRKAASTTSETEDQTDFDDNYEEEAPKILSDNKVDILAGDGRFDPELAKESRLIDWVAGVLEENLKRTLARRKRVAAERKQKKHHRMSALYEPEEDVIPLDEFADKITLSKLNIEDAMREININSIEIDWEVSLQLRCYVAEIASKYDRANPFHNFEHCCHVTMSVIKLLKRVVTPDLDVEHCESHELISQRHHYSYGITSDPLATLAIIFSALIHDVDHRGVSNAQLGKEDEEMAEYYRGKSLAEQNSVDVAWAILMQHKYSELRACLFETEEDINHFRQIVINVVLATDIFDPELNALRLRRWNKAFACCPDEYEEGLSSSNNNDIDLKATIVVEYIIQTSDVSHTMQHWHIYRRWNQRLFQEMSRAYQSGRMAKDPAEFWYKGELSFFDNYIIPLAKKLKDCGVFGVSSDEYLNYAMLNREEWSNKGEAIVEHLVQERDKPKSFKNVNNMEKSPTHHNRSSSSPKVDGGNPNEQQQQRQKAEAYSHNNVQSMSDYTESGRGEEEDEDSNGYESFGDVCSDTGSWSQSVIDECQV